MKKSEIKDSLFESFKNQTEEVNLAMIKGGDESLGMDDSTESIGHKNVKTLLPGGKTQTDSVYQPD